MAQHPLTIILCIIIIIYLLYSYCRVTRNNQCGDNKINKYFSKVSSNHCDDISSDIQIRMKELNNPEAIDYYRYGVILGCNFKEHKEAEKQHVKALTKILNSTSSYLINNYKPSNNDISDVINGIEDYYNNVLIYQFYEDEPDIEEYPMVWEPPMNLDNFRTIVQTNIRQLPKLPQHKQKKSENTNIIDEFENKQTWKSQAQNVHDSNVNNENINHFFMLQQYNKADSGDINNKSKEIILREIRQELKNNANAIKALDRMESNSTMPYYRNINGSNSKVGESDVLVEVWKRINSPVNAGNVANLKEAFISSLDDCVENGNLVCSSGRVSRVIGSLALLDNDENLGVTKTVEAVRNEIYHKSGEITNKLLESQPPEIQEVFNKGESNEAVDILKSDIKNRIDELKNEYKGKMNDIELDSVIDDCKKVIDD